MFKVTVQQEVAKGLYEYLLFENVRDIYISSDSGIRIRQEEDGGFTVLDPSDDGSAAGGKL